METLRGFVFLGVLLSLFAISFASTFSNKANVQVHEIPGRGSDPCRLPPVAGNCLAYIPSYYYDPSVDKCRTFVYGGCGGNSNRFQSEQECRKFRYRCLRKRGGRPYIPRI